MSSQWRQLLIALTALVPALVAPGIAQGQTTPDERMQRAMEQETANVNRLYSTKPILVTLGARQYLIPANYFDPKGKDNRDTFNAKDYFGFNLFFPDYDGFTTGNWQNPNDSRRIHVLHVMQIERVKMLETFALRAGCVVSDQYGDTKTQFRNCRNSLEVKPSLHVYGLNGYRSKTDPNRVTWTGVRARGDFFFFQSILSPGSTLEPQQSYYLRLVKYYSEAESLFIEYLIPAEHAIKWLEIDAAIWRKLHGWQVK